MEERKRHRPRVHRTWVIARFVVAATTDLLGDRRFQGLLMLVALVWEMTR